MYVRKQSGGDVKNDIRAGTCPICPFFWKPLNQSGKKELRVQQPYLYSNLLHRNPHCQAHKRFTEQGESKVVQKTGQKVPAANANNK